VLEFFFQGKENLDGRSHHGGTMAITTARGAYHDHGGPRSLTVPAGHLGFAQALGQWAPRAARGNCCSPW